MDLADTLKGGGLNPFFIRSAVGMPTNSAADGSWRVLVPSSSGLLLEFQFPDDPGSSLLS